MRRVRGKARASVGVMSRPAVTICGWGRAVVDGIERRRGMGGGSGEGSWETGLVSEGGEQGEGSLPVLNYGGLYPRMLGLRHCHHHLRGWGVWLSGQEVEE